MSDVCHRCEKEAELMLYLPTWGEQRPVCRRFLRRVGGVDARTWLEAGYAAWITPERDIELPRELRAREEKELRRQLNRRFGWFDGHVLDASTLVETVDSGDELHVQYIGSSSKKWRDVRVLSVTETENPATGRSRIQIKAAVLAHRECLTIYADREDKGFGQLFVDDGDLIGQRVELIERLDVGGDDE